MTGCTLYIYLRSRSNIVVSYFWVHLHTAELIAQQWELLNVANPPPLPSQTPLLTKALLRIGLAAVISHPPLYFKPSDRGPLSPLTPWVDPTLSVWARVWASAHPRHLHRHTKQLLPAGAKVITEVTSWMVRPWIISALATLTVWGRCSLKFAFLQESWHVCQDVPVGQTMNLDPNTENLDCISTDILQAYGFIFV